MKYGDLLSLHDLATIAYHLLKRKSDLENYLCFDISDKFNNAIKEEIKEIDYLCDCLIKCKCSDSVEN